MKLIKGYWLIFSLLLSIGMLTSNMVSADQGKGIRSFKITNANGTKVRAIPGQFGSKYLKFVVGNQYRVKAKITKNARQALAHQIVVLEHQDFNEAGQNKWKTLQHIEIGRNGKVDKVFTAPLDLKGLRNLRLRLFDSSEGNGVFVAAAATDLGSSETAVVDTQVEFNIQIINATKDDLNVSIPTSVSSTSQIYNTGVVRVNAGATADLLFQGPPPQTIFSTTVTKVGKDKTYGTVWSYGDTPCSANPPPFGTDNLYVRITPQDLTSGYDLFIWGDKTPECTASLDSDFIKYIIQNPWKAYGRFALVDFEVLGLVLLDISACTAGSAVTLGAACVAAIGVTIAGLPTIEWELGLKQ